MSNSKERQEKIRKRYIFLILSFIWMAVIFYFSSQNVDESSKLSGGITEVVVRSLYSNFNELSQVKQQSMLDNISFIIRKGAHFTEYTILGFLLTGFFNTFYWSVLKGRLSAYVVGTVYAITDEVHQLFVPGRSGMIKDVFIDTLGIITGVIVCIIIFRIANIIINKMIKIKGE